MPSVVKTSAFRINKTMSLRYIPRDNLSYARFTTSWNLTFNETKIQFYRTDNVVGENLEKKLYPWMNMSIQ